MKPKIRLYSDRYISRCSSKSSHFGAAFDVHVRDEPSIFRNNDDRAGLNFVATHLMQRHQNRNRLMGAPSGGFEIAEV